MIKLKQIFSLKYIALLITVQLTITLLYINTIAPGIDYLKFNQDSTQFDLEMSRIITFDRFEDIEVYETILDDLNNEGAQIFYTANLNTYSLELDEYVSVILIDENLAKEFVEVGMVKLINLEGTKITVKKGDDSYGTCKQLVLYSAYDCNDYIIEVHDEEYIQNVLMDDFYKDYGAIFMNGIAIKYDGDLSKLINEIKERHNLKLEFSISNLAEDNKQNEEIAKNIISFDRQSFISFIIIGILTILLSTLLYLKSKQRTISILLLLGYSRFSILTNIIMMSTISLIIPYIILKYSKIYVINQYLGMNFLIITLSITCMFISMLKTVREKASERI